MQPLTGCSGGPVGCLAGLQGSGLSPQELEFCDRFVYIPQYGEGTASLNVVVAASIILHHFACKGGPPFPVRPPYSTALSTCTASSFGCTVMPYCWAATAVHFERHKYCLEEHKYCLKEHKYCLKEHKYCLKEHKYCLKEHKYCLKEHKYCLKEQGAP